VQTGNMDVFYHCYIALKSSNNYVVIVLNETRLPRIMTGVLAAEKQTYVD
jgi:hypothetical protein